MSPYQEKKKKTLEKLKILKAMSWSTHQYFSKNNKNLREDEEKEETWKEIWQNMFKTLHP